MLIRNDVKAKLRIVLMLGGLASHALAEPIPPQAPGGILFCDKDEKCVEEKRKLKSIDQFFATLRMPLSNLYIDHIYSPQLIFCSDTEVIKWEIKHLEFFIEKTDSSLILPLTEARAEFLFDHHLKINYVVFPEIGEWNLIVKAKVNGQDFKQKLGPIHVN